MVHFSRLLCISDYKFYLKSNSHWKSSAVLEVSQALYTDVITYNVSTTIEAPTEINFTIGTESGLGSFHKAILIGQNSLPQQPKKPFSLYQVFTYSELSQGDYHTVDLTAFSLGDTPVTRKYSYEVVTYPDRPYHSGPVGYGRTTIVFGFGVNGIVHTWRIRLGYFFQ